MKNPILEELWKVKDEIARECGYDLNILAARLRQGQQQGKRKVVNLSERGTRDPTAGN